MKDKALDWALFWASLLQPIILGEVSEKGTAQFLGELAREQRVFPGMADDARRLFPLSGASSKSTVRRDSKLWRASGAATVASRGPTARTWLTKPSRSRRTSHADPT